MSSDSLINSYVLLCVDDSSDNFVCTARVVRWRDAHSMYSCTSIIRHCFRYHQHQGVDRRWRWKSESSHIRWGSRKKSRLNFVSDDENGRTHSRLAGKHMFKSKSVITKLCLPNRHHELVKALWLVDAHLKGTRTTTSSCMWFATNHFLDNFIIHYFDIVMELGNWSLPLDVAYIFFLFIYYQI